MTNIFKRRSDKQDMMSKAQLLCTLVPNQISEPEFWVKWKKIALFKGGLSGLRPSKLTQLGGDDEKFPRNYSKTA